MALFAIVTENKSTLLNQQILVKEFMNKSKEKLKSTNLLTNPFIGGIKELEYKNSQSLYIISMRPVYFNYSLFGWVILGAMLFMFKAWSPWLLLPLALCALGIFWTKYFFYTLLKAGLKKAGYTGYIRLVNLTEAIENMYFKEAS